MKLLSESGISPKLTVGLSDIVMKLSVHLKATYFRLLESARLLKLSLWSC